MNILQKMIPIIIILFTSGALYVIFRYSDPERGRNLLCKHFCNYPNTPMAIIISLSGLLLSSIVLLFSAIITRKDVPLSNTTIEIVPNTTNVTIVINNAGSNVDMFAIVVLGLLLTALTMIYTTCPYYCPREQHCNNETNISKESQNPSDMDIGEENQS
ncbi:MAG: hypothetical protein GSR81_00235 [Desulfurococcales archaeon]|nr:hypothetical protein [Desulfurococcales archaeon]